MWTVERDVDAAIWRSMMPESQIKGLRGLSGDNEEK